MTLQQQKEQLKAFQNGKKTPEGIIPKTIGLSVRKQKFSGWPLEDLSMDEESDTVPRFEKLLSKRFSNGVSNLDTIVEEDFETTSNKTAAVTTPEDFLMRITSLEHDYDELLAFTRHEENIFNETSRKAEELEKQLELANEKIRRMENAIILEHDLDQTYKIKERELASKITELEERLKERNEDNIALIEDVRYMHKQLVTLQNILIVLSRSEENNAKRAGNILEEYEKKFTALIEEKQTLVDEIKKLETVVASQKEEINKQNNTIQNWESEYLAVKREQGRETQTDIDEIEKLKNSLISKDQEINKLNKGIANQKVCFSDEIDQLSQEIVRKNEFLADYETSAEKLKDEVRQLSEQLTENKANCMKHRKEIDRLTLELVEKEQDYTVLLKENTKFEHKNDNLAKELDKTKIIADFQRGELVKLNSEICKQKKENEKKYNSKLEDETLLEGLKKQLENAQEIDSLQKVIRNISGEMEKVISENDKLEEASLQTEKEELTKHNQKMADEIENYKSLLLDRDKEKFLLRNQIVDLQHDINNQKSLQLMKKQTKVVLKKLINFFITEQKTLLSKRHSQDERNLFKTVLKDLKSNNICLKNLLDVIINGGCDLCEVSDSLIKCNTLFREYSKLEKEVLREQIHELENSNQAYLNEIMSLRKFQIEQEHSKENMLSPMRTHEKRAIKAD